MTTTKMPTREQLLAAATLPADVIARRWEPLSLHATEVLRDWSESGEFAATLAAIHAEDDLD